MIHRIALILLITASIQTNAYSIDYTLNGSFWQKDGRSIGLGGGINASEQGAIEGISISYSLPYLLKPLSTRSVKVAHQTKWMNLDGLWSQTGDAVFMENYLALGVSRNLSEHFTLKVKAGYYHYALIKGGKGSTFLSEIGCKYKLYDKMQINLYLFNPTGAKIKRAEKNVTLCQSFHLGEIFYPVKNMEGLFEIEKNQLEKTIYHLGLEYSLCETFILRTGLSGMPLKPSWGIGGKFNRFKYALGANSHPVLGFSTCFSLYYNW
jgi:hypothetical protein